MSIKKGENEIPWVLRFLKPATKEKGGEKRRPLPVLIGVATSAAIMEFRLGEKSLVEATRIIQELMVDPQTSMGTSEAERERVLYLAKAGVPGYGQEARQIVRSLMDTYGLSVSGMTRAAAAGKIYEYLWGLDVLEELYNLPHVDELRVNNPGKVYYQDRGRNRQADVRFRDDEHISKIIARLLEHDRASLDESNPGCESRRLDGARLTALGPPVARGPCFVLRKHGTFDISDDNYLLSGTMDPYTQAMLKLLVKGRANILICGDSNVGKTTLLRWLAGFLHPRLRVISIETDRELLLDEWYPDRDIISLEAHPETGWVLRRLFVTALRLSPDVIIVGEARGLGEAGQMVNAIRSGHHGSMGTIHVASVYEAVSVLAQMVLEEGRRLPVQLLEDQIASAFNVVVQMYGNSVTGAKKIEHVVEVQKGKEGPEFRELCVWQPSEESYEQGEWVYPCGISDRLALKLFRFGVSKDELLGLERRRTHAA